MRFIFFAFIFISGCHSGCNEFPIDDYINDEVCRINYMVNDDRCIPSIENNFFKSYGVSSADYILTPDKNAGYFEKLDLLERYGAYLLGISILYKNESSLEYFLKAGVNPYEAKGTPYAGIVFIVENKDVKMWEIIKRYYPLDQYKDSQLVEQLLTKCN